MYDWIIDAILDFVSNPVFVNYGLTGLFINGLVSSITPFPTEITTSALILSGGDHTVIFSILAIGSTVGGYIGYYLGYGGNSLLSRLFFRKPREVYRKSEGLFMKYGWLAILLSSWIPIIGDLVPMAAGARKYDLKKFSIAISVGKLTKSAAVVYLTGWLMPQIVGT
jgi:membrane protein YqaA with SNARE-associated domain